MAGENVFNEEYFLEVLDCFLTFFTKLGLAGLTCMHSRLVLNEID